MTRPSDWTVTCSSSCRTTASASRSMAAPGRLDASTSQRGASAADPSDDASRTAAAAIPVAMNLLVRGIVITRPTKQHAASVGGPYAVEERFQLHVVLHRERHRVASEGKGASVGKCPA